MLLSGIIAIWSGSLVSIPPGWVICDGNNGTPDLRNRFVVGAGDTYAVDANGGAVNHNHGFTADPHAHTIPAGANINTGVNLSNITDPADATGTTDNESNLPPYYALAYIMKT